jgi:hypothetical protein
MKQRKPVLVQCVKSGSVVKVEIFDTLKFVYEKYAAKFNAKDYHSWRNCLPKGKPYNMITLTCVGDRLYISNSEFLTEEIVNQRYGERFATALKSKDFFKIRYQFGWSYEK